MTVLYIVIAVIAGWFIGFLDSNLRTAKKIQAAEANAEIKIKDAEKKNQLASQIKQDDPGLLRLKNDNGRFILEMEGLLLSIPLSPDKKKRLIELVTMLRPWLESGQPQPAASQPVAPIHTSPVPDPVQAAVYAPVQSSAQPLPPITKKPEAEKNIAMLSIVAQIDSVLQARIADTALAKKGIRLQESPQGDVEVYFGLDKFPSVDAVPDETIKATIRAAIDEWERKYTPGL